MTSAGQPWFLWDQSRAQARCTCPRGPMPATDLYGVRMPGGEGRLDTRPGCPEHDSCQRYTVKLRAGYENGPWLYCPIHATDDCPEG